jgi:hypothetical protein
VQTRPAWHLAVVLAAAVIVVHAPVLVGGQTWADPAHLGELVPSRLAAAEQVARGEVPAWWSGTGLGVPLAAAPHHGALYPPHWLPGLAPGAAMALLDLILLVHAWCAALGVAIWSRRLGANDVGAVAAGAAFAASGVVGAALVSGAIVALAYLPWIGWAADRVAMAAGARARIRAALALALPLGLVALTGELAIAIDAAVLAVLMTMARARQPALALAATAAAIAGGALLGGAQLVPAVLHLTGDVASAAPIDSPVWLGVVVPGAGAPFLGMPILALAAVAGVVAERRVGAAALGLAALGVLAAKAWPHTGLAGDPSLHVAAASAAAAALAGAGFTVLSEDRPDGLTLALLGGAIVLVAIAAASAPGTGAVIAVVAGAVALLALVAAGSGALAAGAPLAAALIVGHPGALEHATPKVDRAAVTSTPPLLAPAARTPGARVYRPRRLDADDPEPERRAIVDHDTGAGDVASRFGLAKVPTSDPARRAVDDSVWRAAGVAGGRLFDRYGIEWAVLPSSVVPAAGLTVAARHGRWALVDAEPARPRAFVAPRWRTVPSLAEAVTLMFPVTGAGAPLDTAVRVGPTSAGGPATTTPMPPCTVTRPAGDRVDLVCDAAAGGWALLLEAWAPGWTVTVDGRAAAAERIDALIRGVRVEPGRHAITWTYRTPGLAGGALASAIGAAALLGVWLTVRRRS